MNNRLVRNGFMYIVLAVAILVVLFVMFNPGPREQHVPISTLLAEVQGSAERGTRPQIQVGGAEISANVDGRMLAAVVDNNFSISNELEARGLNTAGEQVSVE